MLLRNLHYRLELQSARPLAWSRHSSYSSHSFQPTWECQPRCIRAQRREISSQSCRFFVARVPKIVKINESAICEIQQKFLMNFSLSAILYASVRRAAPIFSSLSYRLCHEHRPKPTVEEGKKTRKIAMFFCVNFLRILSKYSTSRASLTLSMGVGKVFCTLSSTSCDWKE